MQETQQLSTHPVARGLSILGDRWTILILREAFLGRHRFEEFRVGTGASRGTLSSRLEGLVSNGLFYKNPYQSSPIRYEYKLTDKGFGLYSWALLLWKWEEEWGNENVHNLPSNLSHAVDGGHLLYPEAVCRHCKDKLYYDDVERVVSGSACDSSGGSAATKLPPFGSQRRSRSTLNNSQMLSHITDIMGDRWSYLLLGSAFMGLTRYDDFRQQLGVATNILSDRLKLMVETGILKREEYQANPPRFEYHLTEKGKAVYPQTMTLRQWVLEWLPQVNHPFMLKHRTCGNDLAVDVICRTCKDVPRADSVKFNP
jgi:DNA-binding HxlR family transcriptional regulator